MPTLNLTRPRRRLSQKVAHWLGVCRSLMVKQADLGGDGQDQSFEQAFSNLAHAYLKDKAPGLLDYEAGFQLVDRNDDNTKAIGVFGFKVGSQWLYAPVFFIKGDLKGHELLYIKNQDAFVPLKENWIDHLLNKKPMSLGEGVSRNTRELGVRPPDFSQFVNSPRSGKQGSAMPLPGRLAVISEAELAELRSELVEVEVAAGLDKQASTGWKALHPIIKYGMYKLARVIAGPWPSADPRYKGMANLPDVVGGGGIKVAAALRSIIEAYPSLGVAVSEFYAPGEINAAIERVKFAYATARAPSVLVKQAAARPRWHGGSILPDAPIHPIKKGSLQVYTYDLNLDSNVRDLSEEEREKALKDRVVIRDQRDDDEIARAFSTETTKALTNPTESGLYEVLVKPGSFKKMVVLIGPHGPDGRRNFATIIDPEGKKGWINIHPSHIWVGKQHSNDDAKKWVDGLEDAKSLDDDQYVLVGIIAGGSIDGTLPFIVEGEEGGEGGDYRVFRVRFDMFSSRPRSTQQHGITQRRYNAMDLVADQERFDRWTNGERVHLGGKKGTALRSAFGDVFIPTSFKKFKIQDADYEDDQWDAPEFDPEKVDRAVKSVTGGKGQSKDPPTVAMRQADVEMGIRTKTATLEIRKSGGGFLINQTPFNAIDAMVDLVVTHGFREKTAQTLLAEATAASYRINNNSARFQVVYPDWVKSAAPPDDPYGPAGLMQGAPTAPGIPDPPYGADPMGSGMPAQFPQQESMPVPGMGPDPSARDAYSPMAPDPMAAQTANDAAQTGQRDIFDTAMIGALLKTTRDDLLVDRHMTDLMKGLDKVGRLLFLLYWHQEEFEERYGKGEMPELEDSLRNTFEDLGDLVLFLKQKSIEPDQIGQRPGTDLDSVSDG